MEDIALPVSAAARLQTPADALQKEVRVIIYKSRGFWIPTSHPYCMRLVGMMIMKFCAVGVVFLVIAAVFESKEVAVMAPVAVALMVELSL